SAGGSLAVDEGAPAGDQQVAGIGQRIVGGPPRMWSADSRRAAAGGHSRDDRRLRAGLRDIGYVEGKNIVFEYKFAEDKYERLPDLAAELVRDKVDVIGVRATPGTRAAQA